MRGMISRGLPRWKLEMHMFENRLYSAGGACDVV